MGISTGAAMLGGAALGGLMGGSKQSGSTTSTQNSAPWAGVQPHLLNVFGGAEGLYNRGPFNYLTSQSPFTRQAQELTTRRALDPNSIFGHAQGALGDTISGKMLSPDSNPHLRASVQDALGLAGSAFAGQYGGAAGQNLGNSGYQEALARGLGATATNAYANAYGQERQNQLNALQLAPTIGNLDAMQLAGVGAEQDALSQKQYLSPWENLARYQSMLAGNFGGTTTTETPFFTNPFASAMGGALAGGGISRMFGGGGGLTGMGGGLFGSAGMSDLGALALVA
jgi:hypothetical protein